MPWNQDRRRFFSLISPLRFRPYYAPGEFTTLILMRAFFTSSLYVKAYNFESHQLVFPKLLIAIAFSFYMRLILIIVFGNARRTSGPIRQAKGGWTSSDETLRQAVCKFNGKSWKKIVLQMLFFGVYP
ncbi:uncharacterized protein LOC125587947 isoform X3 [Brassica napus]|uniref:uncharacterized protein LOC125587947 isoform X3 n=1 Tax=Brassica napus TaxID=3708 RepID=UPI00207A3792|nr:uncharacterized protein LOC125587947 isoform X3 [Brassica napus]